MAHRAALPRPVIGIAGLGIESSTFSPARTSAAAFHPQRGPEILGRYPFLAPGTALREAADWHGALLGKALPGGTVTAEAFAELSDELIRRLAALPQLDGFWYDIHGAMTVEGVDDAEASLLGRIRATIGTEVVVSTSMDLHGNVSRALVHRSDLITCYRTAPHEDHLDTKERAVRNLVDLLVAGAPRPVKAWIPVPVLLAGEQTSTRVEPARGIYAGVAEVERTPGVTDAAVWVGYAWADEPRNHAAVVVTGTDRAAVAAGAERLADAFWDARRDFAFVAPAGTLDTCLDEALASGARPFFLSDSGDNPTAGGAGDVTWSLGRILARSEFQSSDGPVLIYASIPGPEAVDAAVRAGVGATVTVTAGAAVDDRHAGPLTMTGVVHAVRHGDRDAETEVVLRVGSVRVILTRLRKPYHHAHDFTDLDLDPRAADLVVVKIGYLEPELYAMAADWRLALTPGGVDQELTRLGHHRIRRPMFPFDPDMPDPDLSARIIPASDRPAHAVRDGGVVTLGRMTTESTAADQATQSPDAAFVRRYRAADAEAVADICVRTADAGRDATGMYQDAGILADLFALPYAALEPELAFVLDDSSGRAVGYVFGTADTLRFAERFRDEWLPRVAGRHDPDPRRAPQGPDELMAWLLHHPERFEVPGLEAYPAHMHIDLLPGHQRLGHGGRLLDALLRELTARPVAGMHVGMLTANKPARAFYDRRGFHRIPIEDPALTYLGLALT